MGSICGLSIAGYPLGETKGPVPSEWISFFTPSDFKKRRLARSKRNPIVWGQPNPNDENIRETICEYRASVKIVRERLELFGFTIEKFDAAFRAWRRGEGKQVRHVEVPNVTRRISPARVRRILGSLVERKIVSWQAKESDLTDLESHLLEHLLDYGSPIDSRLVLRALIDFVDPNADVVLDLSDQVWAGYYGPREAAKFSDAQKTGGSRIVVLTEGVTDTQVLQASMRLFYPHLADFFVWPDLTIRMMGGTSGIENTLKALLLLDIRAPVLALFDNDYEGHRAIAKLQRTLTLPANVRLIAYPNIDIVKAWPTDLPTGRTCVDLNGKACSIEFYFGKDVLGEGEARPSIQWSNGSRPGEWQGTVQNKDVLKEKFLAKAKSSTQTELIGDWDDMRTLVRSLLLPLDIPIEITDELW